MPQTLTIRTLDALTIEDERAFGSLPLYADLKAILVRDRYAFRVLSGGKAARWDRALFLNLTFWGGQGGDVLPGGRIAADVVTHAAWHHLAARAFAKRGVLSVDALFLGEAIASAFDVYLVGTLLRRTPGRSAPRSEFLETQVPAMAASAEAAGLSPAAFQALLADVASDPNAAFEALRALLFDVTIALYACRDAAAGLAVLERHAPHRFSALLHRYELSNWVLWARAWASARVARDVAVRTFDRTLRRSPDALGTLTACWVAPPTRKNPRQMGGRMLAPRRRPH